MTILATPTKQAPQLTIVRSEAPKPINPRKGTTTETAPLKWNVATTLLKAMKEDSKNANTRLMLAVGFFTGLRISDILNLKWNQLLNGDLTVKEKKTNKVRTIKIVPMLQTIVNNVYDGENLESFIFISKAYNSDQKKITVTAANKRIKKVFTKYGIEVQNASSHTLRKTFARRIWEGHGKTDEALIYLCELLGHSSTKMTRKYIGITKQVISNLYDCLK